MLSIDISHLIFGRSTNATFLPKSTFLVFWKNANYMEICTTKLKKNHMVEIVVLLAPAG